MTLNKTTPGTGGEPNIIRLEELVFPEDYFWGTEDKEGIHAAVNGPAEESWETVIKFGIEDRRMEKLKKAALWLEVELPELLLGSYFYLLGEISEQPFVVVQTMLASGGQVFPLRVNLNQYADLPELFRAVKRLCARPSKPGLYSLAQLEAITPPKGRQGIIPFFCWDFYPEKASLGKAACEKLISRHFDLQFCLHHLSEARSRAGRIGCSCGFNGGRLRKDMVEKFIHAYLHLLDMVIEKMDSGGLLRKV